MADLPYRQTASQAQPGGAIDRIERAIARIEAAAAARAASSAALARRHETLRARMAEAIAALDAILARPDGTGTGSHDSGLG